MAGVAARFPHSLAHHSVSPSTFGSLTSCACALPIVNPEVLLTLKLKMAAILDWARANPLKTAAALLALVRIYRTRTAAAAAAAPISGKDKIVVVTGCDSGFGKMLSLRLAEAGFTVAAGCLSDDGIKAFEGKSNIIALKLDVTKDDSVESFKAAVEKAAGDKGVFAIVNNAGLANNFYIEATTIQQVGFRRLILTRLAC